MTRHVEVDDELWDEFHRVVNMMSRELMDWLRTRSAVEDAEELPDQACTKTGRRVLEKLQKRGGPHRQRRARDAQGSSTGFTPNAATTSSRPPVRELATPADDHRSRIRSSLRPHPAANVRKVPTKTGVSGGKRTLAE
jgi:hypothetical protein